MGQPARVPRMALALALAAALAPGGASAEGSAAAATAAEATTATESTTYVVGVAVFRGEGLASGSELFLSSLPRLLAADLRDLPPRWEGQDYLIDLRMRTQAVDLYAKGKALADRLDELALRQLEGGVSPEERPGKVAAARAKVDAARADLEPKGQAAQTGTASASVGSPAGPSSGRPVALCADNLAGRLLDPGTKGLLALAQSQKLGLLIHGLVRPLGEGYVAVEVGCFDPSLAKDLYTFTAYADPADPGPVARELSASLTEAVVGRPFARLEVELSPPSASLEAEGEGIILKGRRIFAFGGGTGTVTLTVTAPGYLGVRQAVEVPATGGASVSVELHRAELGKVQVTTIPEALPVFLDGFPLGTSPLELDLTARRSLVAALGPDGAQAEVVVTAPATAPLILEPNRDAEAQAARLEAGRRAFYDSLGLVLLALPVTGLCYGLNSTYYEAAVRSGNANLASAYTATGWALGLSSAAAAGLAVNAIIHLVRYIDAAD